MADEHGDESEDQGEGEGQPEIKELRRAAKKSKENETKAETLERKFAFARVVGIDKVDHPLVAALMGQYQGDLDEAKVREHLESMQVMSLLGAATTESADETADRTPTADSQVNLRTGTIDGGEIAPVDTADPARAGLAAAFDLMDSGATREDAATAFFAKIWEAAAKGDPRVLTDSKSATAADVGS